jgi:hypothetical protein
MVSRELVVRRGEVQAVGGCEVVVVVEMIGVVLGVVGVGLAWEWGGGVGAAAGWQVWLSGVYWCCGAEWLRMVVLRRGGVRAVSGDGVVFVKGEVRVVLRVGRGGVVWAWEGGVGVAAVWSGGGGMR